jgi:hypothetical protein
MTDLADLTADDFALLHAQEGLFLALLQRTGASSSVRVLA